MLTRYRGILVVAGAVGLVWIGSLVQLFRAPMAGSTTATVRLGAWDASGPPSVLMVENDPAGTSAPTTAWRTSTICRSSAPGRSSSCLYRGHSTLASTSAPVSMQGDRRPGRRTGRPVDRQPGDARRAGVQSAGPPDLTLGDLSLPPAESGVHRLADTRVMVGGRDLPTLAMAAARNLGLQPRDGLFRVNFNQGADWIPRVSVERVLAEADTRAGQRTLGRDRLKLLRDARDAHTALRRMARLQDYMLPPDFYKLDEHWGQVITFVDQTLNLNRVIFLEKVEGDHRVREVQALRCSLDDIDERRRDFERVPYSDAIAEGGPSS